MRTLVTRLALAMCVGALGPLSCGPQPVSTTPPPTLVGADPALAGDATPPPATRAEVLAASQLPAAQATALPGDPLGVTIHRLDNGLTVYISTDRQTPRVSAWISVRAGSRHDPANSTGLAHYLEHMLFKGTSRLGTLDAQAERVHIDRIAALYDELRKTRADARRAQILAEIDAATQASAKFAIPNELDQLYARFGITGLNAFTSNERTVYIADVPSNRFEAWMRVEGDRFQNPVFRLFYPELEAVYEEKNRTLDNPFSKVFETLERALYPKHPYGTQPTIGLVEHLKTPAYADMAAYYQRWYVPNNIAIALAGDIDAATALPIIERYFGAWEPKPLTPPAAAPIPPVSGRVQRQVVTQGEESVYIAWQTVPVGSADQPALEVLDLLMDNAQTGLINVDLVLSQKLPRAGSFPDFRNEAGYYAMYGTAREGQSLAEVEELLMGVRDKLLTGAFTEADLRAIVLHAQIQEMRQLESMTARVAVMSDAFVNRRPWSEVIAHTERLGEVTRDDVLRVAREYLTDSRVVVYRRRGDSEPPKIAKPKITPVPIDPSRKSAFVAEIEAMPAEPLAPEWLVAGQHYARSEQPAGPLIATRNTRNKLYTVSYSYELGYRAEPMLCVALDLLEQSGTGELDAPALKRKLYAMGTTVRISCDADDVLVSISGVDETFADSVALVEAWLRTAALDQGTLDKLVANLISQRKDDMDDPREIGQALTEFTERGKDSEYLAHPSNAALGELKVRALGRILSRLPDTQHRTLYFGPRSAADAAGVVAMGKRHRRVAAPKPVRYRKGRGTQILFLGKEVAQSTIALSMPRPPLARRDRAIARLYNEYVGSGMGALIFQEIREARGLAYTARASHRTGDRPRDDSGVFGSMGTQSDKSVEALSTMLELLRDLPMQPGRLATAKESLDRQYRTERIDPRFAPFYVLKWLDEGFDSDPRPAIWKAAASLGEADLQAFARRFAKGGARIGILGNRERIDMDALGKVAPVTEVEVGDLFSY